MQLNERWHGQIELDLVNFSTFFSKDLENVVFKKGLFCSEN